MISFKAPKLKKGADQVDLDYSEVFYSDKNTLLQSTKNPKEILGDIFNDIAGRFGGTTN